MLLILPSLVDFVSIDSVPSEESTDSKLRKPSTGQGRRNKLGKIPDKIQEILWNQSPCTNTKLVADKLSLCVGMPVMVHNNTATEMCITKGQEAIVHSWQALTSPSSKKILDALFVELQDPPMPIALDGLPLNIVLLTKTTVVTNCQLPDDTSISVSRNQVEVLPNFAMTDYASQGKTRLYDVVDLTFSWTHQNYYTALSRGVSIAGTLILSSFLPSKIMGGASGALCQEFRELELLDDITTMHFEGKLP